MGDKTGKMSCDQITQSLELQAKEFGLDAVGSWNPGTLILAWRGPPWHSQHRCSRGACGHWKGSELIQVQPLRWTGEKVEAQRGRVTSPRSHSGLPVQCSFQKKRRIISIRCQSNFSSSSVFLFVTLASQPPFLCPFFKNMFVHESVCPGSCSEGHSRLEGLASVPNSVTYTQWGLGPVPPLCGPQFPVCTANLSLSQLTPKSHCGESSLPGHANDC